MWIAFKNYYLRDEGQHFSYFICYFDCCELLSKIIIFVMKDNRYSVTSHPQIVVNCFQKLLSSWWRTTFDMNKIFFHMLWIAFKNYYLRDEGQQCDENKPALNRCELLSKIIIFVMKDNPKFCKLMSSPLWIAFKNYYLRDEGQLRWYTANITDSCELLSKIIIFVMKDNKPMVMFIIIYVVNCFQKLLSSWWRTTRKR